VVTAQKFVIIYLRRCDWLVFVRLTLCCVQVSGTRLSGRWHDLDMNLGYLIMRLPFLAFPTLDQAYPFVQNALITLGFPDILSA